MNSKPILFNAPMVRAVLDDSKTKTRRAVKPQPPKQPEPDCHPNHKQKHPAPYLDAYCGAQKTKQNPRGMSNQWCWWQVDGRQCLPTFRSPYGQPGDQLWVRETFYAYGRWETKFSTKKGRDEWHFIDLTLQAGKQYSYPGEFIPNDFRKGNQRNSVTPGWWKRPSIHMTRSASRITLEITGVRVERLQEISKTDAWEEGCNQQLASQLGLGGNYEGQEGFIYGGHARGTFAELWKSINGAGSWAANPWVWVVEFKRL